MCVISLCGAFSFTRRDVDRQHRGLVASQQALRSNQIATKLDEFSAVSISRSHRTGGGAIGFDCAVRDFRTNPIVGSCVFIAIADVIGSTGDGLHNLTAVPRSSQLSTVKWVSVFGLSNNKSVSPQWRRNGMPQSVSATYSTVALSMVQPPGECF